jgi:hypothetical protein
MNRTPFDWKALERQQEIRNCIVHADGWITDDCLLRRYFHRQVNIAQSLGFRFQYAAEQNHSRYFAEEIAVVVDLRRLPTCATSLTV